MLTAQGLRYDVPLSKVIRREMSKVKGVFSHRCRFTETTRLLLLPETFGLWPDCQFAPDPPDSPDAHTSNQFPDPSSKRGHAQSHSTNAIQLPDSLRGDRA